MKIDWQIRKKDLSKFISQSYENKLKKRLKWVKNFIKTTFESISACITILNILENGINFPNTILKRFVNLNKYFAKTFLKPAIPSNVHIFL